MSFDLLTGILYSVDIAFTLLGGLGLFLYGMNEMSKGLQRIAGFRLKGFLRTLTPNRFAGVASGTLATAVVQSSSVTTVMIVSFVNAGLMALPQAISVILGAHIGTTITAQIIAFRIQDFALPILALGAALHLFGRSDYIKNTGGALFGFGALFFGLQLMTAAFDPLRDNAFFHNILTHFSRFPLLGLLAGAAITIIVQSSSVTTGITVALALSSVITFEQAVPLILGENIGTTVSANIAAIGGSHAAKQAARAHFIVNGIGAILALFLLKPFMQFVLIFSPTTDIARQIANSHTLFNLLNTILFLPFITSVARLTNLLIFGKKREEELYYLEESSLADPDTALDHVKTALSEMNKHALKFLIFVSGLILMSRERHMGTMKQLGQKIEHYQSRLTEYLEKIAAKDLSQEQSKLIPRFVRILHEIERIRDYEEKMKEVGIRLYSEGRKWRQVEKRELRIFFQDVQNLIRKTNRVLSQDNKNVAEEIIEVYESLNARKDEVRDKTRIRSRELALANYYYDIVSSLEEIARKCRNIAVAMIE